MALALTAATAAPAPAQLLIDTVVGASNGDGFTADIAKFTPAGVAFDLQGNLLIADASNNRIRRIDRNTNIVSTIAGTGAGGFFGEGVPATQAKLFFPTHLAVDGAGNIYISDQLNQRVRRIRADNGTIETVAGDGTNSNLNDNVPAVQASLSFPSGLSIMPDGSLLIADSGHNRIRRVAQGTITTVVGTGAAGYNGDQISATAATLTNPADVVPDARGNLYVADTGNCRIRFVDAQTHTISTLAGTNLCGSTGNGGDPNEARLNSPSRLALNGTSLYFVESLAPRVRRIDLVNDIISAAAGNGFSGTTGDGGPAVLARLTDPSGLVFDSSNRLIIGDFDAARLRRVQDGIISTIAGQSNGDGFTPQVARIDPKGLARNSQGELWIADSSYNRVRRIPPSFATIATAAGTGAFGFSGENVPATEAMLAGPLGIAVDAFGDVFFSDQLNHRVRRISVTSGLITTIAGIGTPSFGGDNGRAEAAGLSFPAGIDFGPDGALYVADSANNRIRRIGNGIITTVVGTNGVGYNGEGLPALSTLLSNPTDVVVDTDNNLYIADRNNCRVRRLDWESGLVRTIAGTGHCGYSGENGPAVSAELNGPEYLALLENRYLYISETFTPRIRRVDLFTGQITRIAGNGLPASTGDGGPALNAQLEMPAGLELDKNNALLYVSDVAAGRVRRLQIETVPPSTFTPTKTQTFTPTKTPTVTQTRTFTQTFTPSNTPTRTSTFTATVTFTPTATATFTSTTTRTFTATTTLTPSPSFTPTITFTASPSITATRTATATSSPSATRTATASFTPTPSITLTRTPTSTSTRTATLIFTSTFTATVTPPPSNTPTVTVTRTASSTLPPTPTRTPTSPPTNTATPLPTSPPTPVPTFTATAPVVLTPPPSPTRSATSTASRTPSATSTRPTATATPSAVRSSTPSSATGTPTLPFTKTVTRTATPSATAVPPTAVPVTATRTPSPLAGGPTATRTSTFPPGFTPSFTLRPTLTPTITRTSTPSSTPTSTRTSPPTRTSTQTPTITRTATISPTVTPRQSGTPQPSPTRTITRTGTPGGGSTPTPTSSSTRTLTRTGTPSSTRTPTPSPSVTPRKTASTPAASATPTTHVFDPACTGDCNGDLVVTQAEVNTVLTRVVSCNGAAVGPCLNVGACARADPNGDGTIGGAEFTRALENASLGCH